MDKERHAILQRAILQFGQDKQIEMAIEEMGELLVAINHYKRGLNPVDAVQEEIADVNIAMQQLAIIYGEDGVNFFEKTKLKRLKDRIIKHAHKNVDPKFHKGDLLETDKGDFVLIRAIEDGDYVLENSMKFSIGYVDKFWRKCK